MINIYISSQHQLCKVVAFWLNFVNINKWNYIIYNIQFVANLIYLSIKVAVVKYVVVIITSIEFQFNNSIHVI